MTRKLFLVLLSVMLSIPIVRAQSSQTINVQTPGTLASLIEGDKNVVTHLTLTGTLTAADFGAIRGLAKLSVLDMGGATVDNATIPYQAFYGVNYQSLVLPEGVKTIGNEAFCKGKIAIPLVFPSTLEVLGESSFHSYQSELDFSKCTKSLATLGSYVFYNMLREEFDFSEFDNLKNFSIHTFLKYDGHIILPNKLTTVGYGVFADYRGSVTLPANLERIEREAFCNNDISELILPEGLKSIGQEAFRGSKIAKPLVLPSTLEVLEEGCFSGSQGKLVFDKCTKSLTSLGRYVFYNMSRKEFDFSEFDNLKNFSVHTFLNYNGHVILPNKLTTVGSGVFADYRGSVTLPANLERIEREAFCNNDISELILPEGLKSIGQEAFRGSKIGKLLILPSTLEVLEEGCFSGYQGELVFDKCTKSLTSLGRYVFYNISRKEFDFSEFDNLKNFSVHTFLNYNGHVILPNKLTTVGSGVFADYRGSVTLPANLERIEREAFCNNDISELILPEGLKSIGQEAFRGSKIGKPLILPSTLEVLEEGCFSGYQGELIFDKCTKSLTSLGRYVFYNMSCKEFDFSEFDNLKNLSAHTFLNYNGHVVLPNTLTVIGSGVFANYRGSVELPMALEQIDPEAFRGCNMSSLILPESLKVIGQEAFRESTIGSLDFSQCKENLFSIGRDVFSGSAISKLDFSGSINLKVLHGHCFRGYRGHVILPVNLEIVPNGSFFGFGGRVTLPPSLKTIDWNAFRESRMTNLVLPAGLTTIVQEAFRDSSIDTLDFSQCKQNLFSLGRDVFSGIAIPELDFSEFVNLKVLHGHCFRGYRGHVILPTNLEIVPNGSFFGFGGRVTLPPGIQTIDWNAFRESRMTNLVLPAGLTTIVQEAFRDSSIDTLDFSQCKQNLFSLGRDVFSGIAIPELDFSEFVNLKVLHGHCFRGYRGHVILPTNLEIVPNGSFFGFGGRVTLPSDIQTIEWNAFRESWIPRLILPEGLTNIAQEVFRGSVIDEPLVLPSTLKSIGKWAFAESRINAFVSLAVIPPALGPDVFAFDKTNCVLYVLGESVELYKAAAQWKDFIIKPYSNVLTDNMLFEKENGSKLYEVKINEAFKVKVFASMIDSLSLGLYVNNVFFEDIVQNKEEDNTFACKISSNISDGKYTIMPYMMKDGERKTVSRPLQSHIIDRLPIVVNNWTEPLTRATKVNNHMLLNAGVANLLEVEIRKSFKVYMRHTDVTADVKIGLFDSENGSFIANVTESVRGDEFTCVVPISRVNGNTTYTLIPYNEVSGKVSYIERSAEKEYLIDRLPVYVKASANGFSIFEMEQPAVSASFDSSTGILHFSNQVEKVELYDIMRGSLVKSLIVKGNEISIQDVKDGTYVLYIHTKDGKISQKIKKY